MDIINSIKNSSDLMHIILNQLNTGIYVIDEKYRVTSFNSYFKSLTDLTHRKVNNTLCDDIMGCVNVIGEVIKIGDIQYCRDCELVAAIKLALEHNRATVNQNIVREHGSDAAPVRKYYRFSCKPLKVEGHQLAVLMIDDITYLEQQKAELYEQNTLIRKYNENFQQDLALAKSVQKSIIPKDPVTINGYRIDFMYFPLEEIGGDMFDILPLDDGKVGIFMCDVIGHGLPAALVTTMVKAILSSDRELLSCPQKLMNNLNHQIIEMVKDPYMTAFYGVLDTTAHTFSFVRAGHPFPWKLSGAIQTFGHCSNPMIGIDNHTEYQQEVIDIAPQDKIMLYTDGLLEAGTDDGHYERRLVDLLDEHPAVSGKDLLELMKHDLISNVVYDKHMDDICILMVDRVFAQKVAMPKNKIS